MNGEMCSSELPALYSDPAVALCMHAFCAHLPYSVAMQSIPRWYLLNQAPGKRSQIIHLITMTPAAGVLCIKPLLSFHFIQSSSLVDCTSLTAYDWTSAIVFLPVLKSEVLGS